MKRYDPEPDHYGGCDMCSAKMEECEDGEYVLFEDATKSAMREANSNAVLAEVRAVLEVIVECEYRIFHSDSLDENTGLEEKIIELYKKVSEHFS